jgi:hypothetical protein
MDKTLEELKREQYACPFAVLATDYGFDPEKDVKYLCWLKTHNYLLQNVNFDMDGSYAECQVTAPFSECDLYITSAPMT